MQLTNTSVRYGVMAQALHWAIFLLVAGMFGLGWYMEPLPLGPEKLKLYNLHKSIGFTILVLMLLRLLWRWITPPPRLPASMPSWEAKAARAAHWMLYLLILAQAGVGILHSWSANFPVVVFDAFTLPNLTGADEALKKVLGATHYYGSWIILALVGLHAAAALRHHFIEKDDVLRRMLPF